MVLTANNGLVKKVVLAALALSFLSGSLLMAFAEPQYRARCKQLGADAFLDKSNEFFQLVDVAEALLNKRLST